MTECYEPVDDGFCKKEAIGRFEFHNDDMPNLSIPLCEEHAPDLYYE